MSRHRFAAILVAVSLGAGAVAGPATAVVRRRSAAAGQVVAEKDVNLDEAGRLARILRAAGLRVEMTRTRDVFVPLRSRTDQANNAGADLFVSVHNNGSSNAEVQGSEVYAQLGNAAGIALAERILSGLTSSSGTRGRGVFQRRGDEGDYYFVLRSTTMRAVIVEGAYLSNPAEARQLATPSFREQAAEGIAAGILADFQALTETVSRPVPPPRLNPGGAALAAPTGLAAAADGGTVRLTWRPVVNATGYRVWRDGELVAQVLAPEAVLGLLDQTDGPGGRLSAVDDNVPLGNHSYEVRALVDLVGLVLQESPSATTSAVVPWLVFIDPGHGGSDPGALGRT